MLIMFFKKPLLLVFFSCLLTSCSPDSKTETVKVNESVDSIKVVTTFPPLYSFATNVLGDQADVYNLVEPGASIHLWEPSASDLRALAQADLLIMNGLGLERFMDDMIESAENPDLEILVMSESLGSEIKPSIEMLELDDSHGNDGSHDHEEDGEHSHLHGGDDPHIWLNPLLVVKQIESLRDTLTELDPLNAELYVLSAEKYITDLINLDAEIASMFISSEKMPFIVFHDAYGYFTSHYDLSEYQIAAIEPFPGKEPTAVYFQELLELIDSNGIEIVFTEPQFNPRIVKNLVEETAISTFEIDPIGLELKPEAYENNLRALASTFLSAFDSLK